MKKPLKLIAVGTTKPNPGDWNAWDNVTLYIARSVEDAVRMEYPHIKGKPCCDNACEVDMSRAVRVMVMEPYIGD